MNDEEQELRKLHDLCHRGNEKSLEDYLKSTPPSSYWYIINQGFGESCYTTLHVAVNNKNPQMLRVLLTYGCHVNALCSGNYTPLHLAASHGDVECIKVLLEFYADPLCRNEFGSTPYTLAELNDMTNAARILKSAEIKAFAQSHASEAHTGLSEFLEELNLGKDIEKNCLEEALEIATSANNYKSIGVLICHGAKNIKKNLQVALLNVTHFETAVILLLCHAAKNRDRDMIWHICNRLTNDDSDIEFDGVDGSACVLGREYLPQYWNKTMTLQQLSDLRKAARSMGKKFLCHPLLFIALQQRFPEAVGIILLEFYCDKQHMEANWNEVGLTDVLPEWIAELSNFKKLSLSLNKLKRTPGNLARMSNLVHLNIASNSLTQIPKEVFGLNLLVHLDLSNNKIGNLQNVNRWSKSIKYLNLSGNKLKRLPETISKSAIEDLNLAQNNLGEVQQCICCIKTLKVLDIGNNKNIKILPPELAKLRRLENLGMKELNKVKDPPPELLKSTESTLDYLRAKLRKPTPNHTMRLMILGERKKGKTTLMHRLDMDFSFNEDLYSRGMDVRKVTIGSGKKPPFVFKCMDFSGETDYSTLHQCFLSPKSLYLLVWNVTDREEGIDALKQRLYNLDRRVPVVDKRLSIAIIVGTHLDMISADEIQDGFEARMNNKVSNLKSGLKQITIPGNGILMVTCNSGDRLCRISIEKLRQVIYSTVEKEMIIVYDSSIRTKGMIRTGMGEKFPLSYSTLADTIERHRDELLAKKKIPVLTKSEFDQIVKQNAGKTGDIFYPDEHVTKFLHFIGAFENYDVPNEYLNNLYFLDPSWLYDLMVNIIAFAEKTCDAHRKDLVYRKDIELMLKKTEKGLSPRFFPAVFELLQLFQIVVFVDNDRLLIPSLLLPEPATNATRPLEPKRVLIRRHEFSEFSLFPPCFWGRFIGRFLHHFNGVLNINGVNGHSSTPDQNRNSSTEFNEPADISYLLGCGRLRLRKESLTIIHPRLFLSVSVKFADNTTVIETKVSRNPLGYHAICQVVDHLYVLVHEWYPVLALHNIFGVPRFRQLAICPICSDSKREFPCKLDVNECIRSSFVQKYIRCPKEHIVRVQELCPELMLMDVPPELRLNEKYLRYDEAYSPAPRRQIIIGNYRGTQVDIKVLKIVQDITQKKIVNNFQSMKHEITIMRKIDHPNIIQFIGVSLRPGLCLVTELASHDNLRHLIKGEIGPTERILIYRIAQQIASALSYLHEHDIVHRNVLPEHIKILSTESTAEVNVKLANFGKAEFLSQSDLNSLVGSSFYQAPEARREKHNAEVDVFSFADVLYVCITKRYPFEGVTARSSKLASGRPSFYDTESTRFGFLTLAELMLKAWEKEPIKRPSSHEVLHQLSTSCFCLLYGKQHFQRVYKPHELFFLQDKQELWQCSYDIASAAIIVMDMTNATIKTRINPVLCHMNINFYTHSVHVIDKNHVAMILNTTENDYLAFYSTMDYSFIGCHEFNEGSHITTLSVSHQCVFIGLASGYLLKVAKSDFLIGQFNGLRYLVSDSNSVSVIEAFESHLFVSCGHSVFKYQLNSEDEDHMAMTVELSLTESVSNMIISPDGLMLFISFQDSPIVCCYMTETMKSLGHISCSDVIRVVFPHRNPCDEKVMSFCIHADTLWVGTGTGHVLIYEINPSAPPKFITWLQPYKSEVSCMTVCNSVGPMEMVGPKFANLVVTFGKNVNPKCYSNNLEGICELTEFFPVDESQENKPFQRGIDLKTEYLALIWDPIKANVLRKISYPN